MIRRATALLLVSGLLATSGCCGWVYRPFGPGTLCDTTNCGCCEPCGPACGPVCGAPCGPACGAPCGPVCEEPCGPACGPCGPSCGPSCGPVCDTCRGPGPIGACHPLLWMLFHPLQWGACNGCGDLYLGDFHGDPPDCCDPCDECGNWTGRPSMGGPMMGYGPAPGPVAPAGPAAPAATCPTCGHAYSGGVVTRGYASNQAPPRVVSQTAHVVRTAPAQAVRTVPAGTNPYATQTSMVPSNTVRR